MLLQSSLCNNGLQKDTFLRNNGKLQFSLQIQHQTFSPWCVSSFSSSSPSTRQTAKAAEQEDHPIYYFTTHRNAHSHSLCGRSRRRSWNATFDGFMRFEAEINLNYDGESSFAADKRWTGWTPSVQLDPGYSFTSLIIIIIIINYGKLLSQFYCY